MFKKAGEFSCMVKNAYLAEPKFPKNNKDNVNSFGQPIIVQCDLVLQIEEEDGSQFENFHLEISNRTGQQNFSQTTKIDTLIKTLNEIGFAIKDYNDFWTFVDDECNLPKVTEANLKCRAVVKEDPWTDNKGEERITYRIKYLNSMNGGEKRINKASLFNQIKNGGFVQQNNKTSNTPAATPPINPNAPCPYDK